MNQPTQDIIIEFAQTGNVVKVTAICPITYIEAFIIGDPKAPREYLINLATKRLVSVIKKRTTQPNNKKDGLYS